MNAMWRKLRTWLITVLLLIAAVTLVALQLRHSGLSARAHPGPLERLVAKQTHHWLVPEAAKKAMNPLSASSETLKQGRDHWADHCATCHANNGSGDTEMGRNLYPAAPDMRTAATQSISDGELYYIIRNGVPLTGMPAWGDPNLGDSDSKTWALVSFIHHLPALTPEEIAAMEKLNPKSTTERQEEQAEEDFLSGKPAKEKKANNYRRKR